MFTNYPRNDATKLKDLIVPRFQKYNYLNLQSFDKNVNRITYYHKSVQNIHYNRSKLVPPGPYTGQGKRAWARGANFNIT